MSTAYDAIIIGTGQSGPAKFSGDLLFEVSFHE